MDTPATPPQLTPSTPRGPLGRTFVITLLAPLVPLALCIVISLIGGRASKDSAAPWAFLFLLLPVMLGCSIACAVQVGTRKGVGLGILTFFGTQVLYLSAAFAGCIASFSNVDFR